MPNGAKILCLQMQNAPCIWAQVNDSLSVPNDERTFLTIGTGNPFPEGIPTGHLQYIGTYQLSAGRLVFHVYELLTD